MNVESFPGQRCKKDAVFVQAPCDEYFFHKKQGKNTNLKAKVKQQRALTMEKMFPGKCLFNIFASDIGFFKTI